MRTLMRVSLVFLLGLGSVAAADLPPPAQPVPDRIEIAAGPFQPTWESLKAYRCPDWFRDAKLGIWGILGPQSLPEAGDWYARNMYIEGHAQYRHHLAHYGHPSTFGYKDLAAQWKAEKFDPARLMALYKEAGAKYFVVLANHHDNWDNWNSTYHRWNSVNWGPRKDLVGLWAQAARKEGLRFGVTEHLARSYSWFNTNKGSDQAGPLAGVPYDGADPAYADLYFPPHADKVQTYPVNPPEWWTRQWYWRMRDLIDTYRPDVFYSDGGVPFGEVGRSLFAHLYNANLAWHGGKLEAVYALKDIGGPGTHGEYVDGIGVQDVERGVLPAIKPEPWQTDTCIGDWFYKSGLTYKPASLVIALLADIVSKNGNLLLNIPLRHDGTIDADEEAVLKEMGAWMAVNGEAIYATRPWAVFGEGATVGRGGHFNEQQLRHLTAADFRFTTKDGALYAIAFGWPADRRLVIRSLAAPAGKVAAVSLLGHGGPLEWKQTDDGLVIGLPEQAPCRHAFAFKITGDGLKPAPIIEPPAEPVRAGADGALTLPARRAIIHGASPQYEEGRNRDNIGFWHDAKDFVSWDFVVDKPGRYAVSVMYSCAAGQGGSRVVLETAGQKLALVSQVTGSWTTFRSEAAGVVRFDKAGPYTLTVKPDPAVPWKVIGLRAITLKME